MRIPNLTLYAEVTNKIGSLYHSIDFLSSDFRLIINLWTLNLWTRERLSTIEAQYISKLSKDVNKSRFITRET